jgi:hypothetical protein
MLKTKVCNCCRMNKAVLTRDNYGYFHQEACRFCLAKTKKDVEDVLLNKFGRIK